MWHPAQPASPTESDVASSWVIEDSSISSTNSGTAPFQLSPRTLHELDLDNELLLLPYQSDFPSCCPPCRP